MVGGRWLVIRISLIKLFLPAHVWRNHNPNNLGLSSQEWKNVLQTRCRHKLKPLQCILTLQAPTCQKISGFSACQASLNIYVEKATWWTIFTHKVTCRQCVIFCAHVCLHENIVQVNLHGLTFMAAECEQARAMNVNRLRPWMWTGQGLECEQARTLNVNRLGPTDN